MFHREAVLPRVELLCAGAPAIAHVARRLNEEWGRQQGYRPAVTLAWCRTLAGSQTEALLCASIGDEIVGMAALTVCDLATHTHLTPWLSSLLVEPAHRGQDCGRIIADAVCALAAQRGARDIYLYALSGRLVAYYARLGWMPVEGVEIDGARFQIMVKPLAAPTVG